jgi:hypothetical protein
MKVYHKDKDGDLREVNDNSVDYGDGNVMIQYKDDNEVAIVSKSELILEPS